MRTSCLAFAALVAACGGGTSSAPPPPYDRATLVPQASSDAARVIAGDDGAVYAVSDSGIWRARATSAGAAPERIAYGTPIACPFRSDDESALSVVEEGGIRVHDGAMYVSDSACGIWSQPLDGGPSRAIVGFADPYADAPWVPGDGLHVAFDDVGMVACFRPAKSKQDPFSNLLEVWRMGADGTLGAMLGGTTKLWGCDDIVALGGGLVIATSGHVERLDPKSGTFEDLGGIAERTALSLVGDAVLWPNDGAIWRATAQGPASSTSLPRPFGTPAHIASDGRSVFATSADALEARIVAFGRDGSQARSLELAQGDSLAPWSEIAVTADRLWFLVLSFDDATKRDDLVLASAPIAPN